MISARCHVRSPRWFVIGLRESASAPSTSRVSLAGKYHSTKLPGSWKKPEAMFWIGVRPLFCHGRGSPEGESRHFYVKRLS